MTKKKKRFVLSVIAFILFFILMLFVIFWYAFLKFMSEDYSFAIAFVCISAPIYLVLLCYGSRKIMSVGDREEQKEAEQ